MRDRGTVFWCAIALVLMAGCGDGGGSGATPPPPSGAADSVVVRATSGEIRVADAGGWELILRGVEESAVVATPDESSAPVRTDDLVAAWRERPVADVAATLDVDDVELANLELDLAAPSWDPTSRVLRLPLRLRSGADRATIDQVASAAPDGQPDFGAAALRIDPASGSPVVSQLDDRDDLTIRLDTARRGICVAELRGSFGFHDTVLEGLVREAQGRLCRIVGFDISRVRGLDSWAAEQIAAQFRALATNTIDAAICGPLPTDMSIEGLTRLITIFTPEDSCESLEIRSTCFDGIRNGGESDVDCGGPSCDRCNIGKACAGRTDCQSDTCGANGRCVCPDAQTTFEVDSSTGGLFDAAEWKGGTITRWLPGGCSLTVQLPRGRVDGLCGGEGFKVVSVEGYASCDGTGGSLGNGCSMAWCPPAGIAACCNVRPSCSAALNGSARSSFTVSCRG